MTEITMSKSLAGLRPEDFEAVRGDSFALAVDNREVALKLVTVERLGHALREGGAFSLHFHGPLGATLPQAIYPLRHAKLGTVDVFVVPLGPKDGVNRYEAVFT
jgi:hypothetical protein